LLMRESDIDAFYIIASYSSDDIREGIFASLNTDIVALDIEFAE